MDSVDGFSRYDKHKLCEFFLTVHRIALPRQNATQEFVQDHPGGLVVIAQMGTEFETRHIEQTPMTKCIATKQQVRSKLNAKKSVPTIMVT
jgi:hypothetical protein